MTTQPTGNAPVQQGINTNNAQNASNVPTKQKGRLTTGQKVAIVALAIFVAAALFPLAAIAPPMIILAPVVGLLVGIGLAAAFRRRNIRLINYPPPIIVGSPVRRWYHPLHFWNWTVFRPNRWNFRRRRTNHVFGRAVPRVVRHNPAGRQVPGTSRTTRVGRAPAPVRMNRTAGFSRGGLFGGGARPSPSVSRGGLFGGGLPTRGFSSSGSRASFGRTSFFAGGRRG